MTVISNRLILGTIVLLLVACSDDPTGGSGGEGIDASEPSAAVDVEDGPAACVEDADCDDGDPCTSNACVEEICEVAAVAGGCCNQDEDCAAYDACTEGTCVDNVCEPSPVTDDCCLADSDCPTYELSCVSAACTDNRCIVSDGCKDSDCDDGDPCTTGAWDPELLTCSFSANDTSCLDDQACDDGDLCTVDTC
ncbi:MAG: hypothetical protein VX938_04570, partial [Myxococcota bacterium]|nr:hypothetical protein [Myxococcota bacterium]